MAPAVSAQRSTAPSGDRAPVDPLASHPLATETQLAQSRHDVLRDAWTIFAPGRADRPHEFTEPEVTTKANLACPFCEGNEDKTPSPVWIGKVVRTQDSTFRINRSPSAKSDHQETRWSVRVVPNKYPAVSPGQGPDAHIVTPDQPPADEASLFQSSPIFGGHEVVIESKHHSRSLTDRSVTEAELVFLAYRDRLDHYRNDPQVKYANVFKNVGQQAGASLAHSHSQIMATNQIPRSIQHSFDRMKRHRAKTGCCLMCDLIREERRSQERVITRDDHTIAYCPFASHLPMLVRVTTVKHQACYEDLIDQAIR